MEEGCSGQPGQEGSVLDRVPGPVASPAEDFVGPPAAENDTGGEEAKGDEHPAASRSHPTRPEMAAEQGSDAHSERDRHAHVAQVEGWWMDDHQPVVLQQRVGAGVHGVGPRLDSRKGVGGAGNEEREEGSHREDGSDRVGGHLFVFAACGEQKTQQICAQDEAPEQDGAFQGRPEADNSDVGGAGGGADHVNVLHGEVMSQERVLHDQVGDDE